MTFFRFLLLPLCMLISIQLWSQQANNLIFYACSKGDYDVVKLCLQKKIDPNQADKNGVTPLMYASECGNDSVCELLLSFGANPNAMAHVNGAVPPITNTVIQNNPRMLDLMLQFGGNPNLMDNADFLTPLHYAVREGYLECADVLLFHGAHPNKVCRNKNPLQIVAYYGDTIMAELLLHYGGNINQKPSDISPLCVAIQRNDPLTAAWLIRHGADVNDECRLGPPIVYSAIYADEKMSKLLCDNGADINALSFNGYNSASLSLMSGNHSNQHFFENHGGGKSKKLILGSISAAYLHEFCKHDYRMGFRVCIHESHFNIGVSAAYIYRPRTRSSLVEGENNSLATSQINLKLAQVGIEKRFSFRHQQLPDIGGYVGCFGSYCMSKSEDLTPNIEDNKVMFTSTIGFYQRFSSVGISAGYKYYNNDLLFNLPKHLAEIDFSVYFNTNRKVLGKFKMY